MEHRSLAVLIYPLSPLHSTWFDVDQEKDKKRRKKDNNNKKTFVEDVVHMLLY